MLPLIIYLVKLVDTVYYRSILTVYHFLCYDLFINYLYKLKMPVSMLMMLAFPFSNIYNKGFWYHSSICLSERCQYLIILVVMNMDANKMT